MRKSRYSDERRRAPALAIGAVLVAVFHPYLLGLSGRIGEFRFQRSLAVGMPRAAALQAGHKLGGWDDSVDSGDEPKDDVTRIVRVRFIDAVTFCVTGGSEFDLTFSPQWRLEDWETQRWSVAC